MITVMIIEDDPMVREINSKFLDKIDGFKLCKAAGSISEATKYILETPPDLILLDIYLPKSNGLEFLKWLRKEEVACDVILITADKSIGSVQEAFRYGTIDYLIKPFKFERFRDAMTQYRNIRKGFNSSGEIEQETLDRYLFNKRGEGTLHEDMAKCLNSQTYERIWSAVSEWGDRMFTSDEAAEMLGMARVTVRRYLDFMQKEGKLDIEIEYGKVGRPHHRYKINHCIDQKDQNNQYEHKLA
jgi:response regulator of citrate/malate metabolism